ncbi:MAG: ROK family protein [Pseudomonadota bacterium]
MSRWRLVADVGGTNVRFARADADGNLAAVRSEATATAASFAQALARYLAATGGTEDCAACAIGAAGPVDDGRVTLTNLDWTIARDAVAATLGGVPVVIVNDLEAVASALPHLAPGDSAPFGGPRNDTVARRAMLAVNVGTGFGAALAVRHDELWWTLPGEAGHMTLGTVGVEEAQLLAQGGTVEDLLSGNGLSTLYARLTGEPLPAAEVIARAAEYELAYRAVEIATTVLGRVAGDLALATGAESVFLTGSVALGLAQVAEPAGFRAAFEAKGPMRARMQGIPTSVVTRDHVSLLGLAMRPIGS